MKPFKKIQVEHWEEEIWHNFGCKGRLNRYNIFSDFLYFKKQKRYMKKIYSSLHTSMHTSPFFGRTIAVLSFFCLLIKQLFIFLAYSEVFKEATFWLTIAHYLWYFVSDFIVFLILIGLVAINTVIKKTFIKIINNIILSVIFLLFVLDIFTIYFFQSRISILDMHQFINPSLWDFSWMIPRDFYFVVCYRLSWCGCVCSWMIYLASWQCYFYQCLCIEANLWYTIGYQYTK